MTGFMRPHFWLFLLTGCAILPPDDKWYPTDMKPAMTYEWNIVPKAELYKVCGINPPAMPTLGACAFNLQQPRKCIVYSWLDEHGAARTFSGDGISLFEHEMRHCGLTDGIVWRH